MSDTWGGLSIPVAVPAAGDALGDHALRVVGDYLRAVINANGNAAWRSFMADTPARPSEACLVALLNDPRQYGLNEEDLPALYLFRSAGIQGQVSAYDAIDYLEDGSSWTAFFVFPPAAQADQNDRDTFANGVQKLAAAAIENYRDPSYVVAGDADPAAATLPVVPTAIKLQVATSASPQTFTGAGLDGVVGHASVAPRRPVVVTLGGNPAAFVNGSTITVTGLDVVGQPLTSTFTVNTSAIPGSLTGGNDFSQVTSVMIAAQVGAGGTVAVGLGAYAGQGTLYLEESGLEGLELRAWKMTTITLKMEPPRSYYALELNFDAKELYEQDLTTRTSPNTGTTVSFLRSDASLIEQADYEAP